jgi:cyclase
MLAYRIIPSILKRRSQLIKGEQFRDRVVGLAMQSARIHGERGVDELMLIDVAATPEGSEPDYAAVEELSAQVFIPLTVAGGITKIEHVKGLLRSGADKVAICTAAIERPSFLTELADHFGSQAIVAAIDVRKGYPCSHRGTRIWDMIPVVTYAIECERRGAGEILLTDIERDGTMTGYNLHLINAVSHAVSIPVIASGGCSGYDDMHKAIQAGASAVASGALFQFENATPREAAEYLSAKGLEVRL